MPPDESFDRRLVEPEGDHGAILANISRRIVQRHKEYYGKGPTRAKTYYIDNVVLVMLRGGYTRVEETLLREGRGRAVMEQRAEFQEVMGSRFREVISDETGRDVTAFISGNRQDPDILLEVFILEEDEGP